MPVELGVIFSQADSGTDAAAIRRFAVDAEAAGFEHLLAYDHVLGASAAHYPGPVGSFPGPPYTDEHLFHEVLVLFSHLAAATTTLRFVTSVLVLPQRQVVLAAKQIATVDLLSEGRLGVAVGVGWNRVEYEGLGVEFATRGERLEEQVALMRRLWTEPLVTFSGRFHQLDRVGINPLPSRPIPIWVGTGASREAIERVVRIADGWMPLLLPGLDATSLTAGVARLRRAAHDAGRDPASLPVHARVYVGPDGWQATVEEALAVGADKLSVGFNRIAFPGRSHAEHLAAIIEAKPAIDALVSS